MQTFRATLQAAIAECTGTDPAQVRLERPRDTRHGDLAFPCFVLAKSEAFRGTPPPKIAAELAEKLNAKLEHIKAIPTGPFLNFRIDRPHLAQHVFNEIEAEPKRYGQCDIGQGRNVVVDLSSPNIAKPMHVGHLRSTIIGASIQRLHDLCGYKTVGINHIGDWGSQFGKLVVAIQRWGDTVDIDADPIRNLLKLYVRYHEEEETKPELAEEARAAFRELESGKDGEVRTTWKRITELSLKEFDKIYKRLGVSFDVIRGEAYYEHHLDATVDRIVETGITEESEGALIVDLEDLGKNMPPCLLRKTDGTTLYATRDLAAAFHRWDDYEFERCLYVVGSDQKLHFRQFIGVIKKMGLDWHEKMEHVSFGMLRLPEGKLQTRKGRVVFLDDVLDRAVEEARRIITEKNPELPNLAEIAEQVGVGAVIFNDLKRERVKDIEFKWEEVVSFEGDTGPYVQYTHSRLASVERKVAAADEGGAEPDLSALEDCGELLANLARFPDVVRSAAEHAEPSEVSNYLLALAREVNSWYTQARVLGQDGPVTAARLKLAIASKTVIANGLRLIGLAAPEEM